MSRAVLKTLLTTLIVVSLAAWPTLVAAYVVQITTSIPVAGGNDAKLKDALRAAIDDILEHAIAFEPTVVEVRDARVVGDRVYILLLIADDDGEDTMKTLSDATTNGL